MLTYYYAVVCKDASGNQSALSVNSAATNKYSKRSYNTFIKCPGNFVADGDLSEWQSITPFRMFISDGTGYIAPNTQNKQ